MTRDTSANRQTAQEQPSDGDAHPSLEDIVREYLAARGEDNVVQITVNRDGLKGGLVILTAHTGTHDDLPEIITETNVITHNDHQYELYFDEDPYGPSSLGRITLYGADPSSGTDTVPPEDGLAAAHDYMQDFIDHETIPRTRTEE
jgi:hypothetical protein